MEYNKHIQEEQGIIDPEIPEAPEEKLALLNSCLEALQKGLIVRGITPRHVGTEGMYSLTHSRRLRAIDIENGQQASAPE